MSQRLEIGQDAGRIARLAEDVQILGRPRYAGMASQRIGARQHEGDAGLDQMRKAFGIEFRRVRWRIEGGGFAVHPQGNGQAGASVPPSVRSEEHTSELQSLMRISYAVFYLKKHN